jgi:hypothetical protein
MARKKKKNLLKTENLSPELLRHFRQLGLDNVEEYKSWCTTHGCSTRLNKSWLQLWRERDISRTEKADRRLKSAKKTQNLRHFLKQAYRQEIYPTGINDNIFERIVNAFRRSSQPKVLLRILLYLEANSNLFKDPGYIEAIIALADHYGHWIRPLEDWGPRSYNKDRQFASLLRHLLARYDVPVFMDRAFFEGSTAQQKWFHHLGMGKNIRTAENLPVTLTKRMAHYFMEAPESYSIEGAIRWGQVHALGGDQRLVEALMGTRLAADFHDDDFWLTVIRFFIEHPMLDTAHVNPIVDFIWNRKYENQVVFVARGVAEERGPVQPDFSMQGRTPEALLRQVDEWHRQLGIESGNENLQWVHSRYKDFGLTMGKKKSENSRTWRIRELLNSKELIAEGRAMKHCVATYAESCHEGKCTIWSMTVEEYKNVKRVLTIEVDPVNNFIRQVRGIHNRLAEENEKRIIRKWSAREELQALAYLKL